MFLQTKKRVADSAHEEFMHKILPRVWRTRWQKRDIACYLDLHNQSCLSDSWHRYRRKDPVYFYCYLVNKAPWKNIYFVHCFESPNVDSLWAEK